MRYKLSCSVGVLWIGLSCSVFATDLGQLLENPKSFDNQYVDVVGVARVPGDFYLFQDASAASKFDESKSAWILQKTTGSDNFRFDRQWVRVTGVVDAKEHGRGVSRCVILLGRVELAPNHPPPRIKDANIYGFFHNATSKEIHVELSTANKFVYTEFWIPPGGTNGGAEIHEGDVVATAVQDSSNVPVWEQPRGALVAKGEIKFPRFPANYEYSPPDSDERTLYYQIADGKIELVSPSQAKRWKK